ncbi:MAG: glycosyltransferase family A protein [Cyanobacteriota bacterium]|nr:glycosyltransferase family A protein [Cyanobacteriota bacterium]
MRWLLGWALALRLPTLPRVSPRRQRTVSVLIPARDEATTLPHLLAALARQSLRPEEVVVVDDHSADATAAIAHGAEATLPLRVIQPPPLPAGWCGKTWALHHGVLDSHGEVLIFLDADTEPGPSFLERLVAVLAVPMGPGCGVAFGPAMASSRDDYERVGGHAAVADKVVEDWFLAHRYERAGLPVSAWIGGTAIAYRMYPGGLRDMVVGFDKNFATAAGEVRWPWMVAVLLWLSGLFWAAWCLPAAFFDWPLMGRGGIGANAVIYGAFALQLLLLSQRVGRFRWVNVIFPLPVVFFLGVFLLAIVNVERGRVEWKGRSFRVR